MKKILIAIDNDFIRETYEEVFKTEGFEVFVTKSGIEAIDLAKEKKPDVIMADIAFDGMKDFELLEKFKKDQSLKGIPVIVFAQLEQREVRQKAMDLEARDFITAAGVAPGEVVRRVKIILGEQKSYRIKIQMSEDISRLQRDLEFPGEGLKCSKCGATLELYLIRDLIIGNNHFITSFVCPECGEH
ncbi:MAG: response regulator [Candidatus Nealsonbacteria bacterium]